MFPGSHRSKGEKAGQMRAPVPLLSVAFVHPEQLMEVPLVRAGIQVAVGPSGNGVSRHSLL